MWGEAYPVVGDAGRDIVGGGGLTVAAAGGWLMGGGLSALSRTFGYGIDNVVAFEVVTADGSILQLSDAVDGLTEFENRSVVGIGPPPSCSGPMQRA